MNELEQVYAGPMGVRVRRSVQGLGSDSGQGPVLLATARKLIYGLLIRVLEVFPSRVVDRHGRFGLSRTKLQAATQCFAMCMLCKSCLMRRAYVHSIIVGIYTHLITMHNMTGNGLNGLMQSEIV